jgi:hypothetical protein
MDSRDLDNAIIKSIYSATADRITDLILGYDITPQTFLMFYRKRLEEYIRVTPLVYRRENTFLSLIDLLANDLVYYAPVADYIFHPEDISPIPILRSNQSFDSIVAVGKEYGYTRQMLEGMARELVFILDSSYVKNNRHIEYMDILLNPRRLRYLGKCIDEGIRSSDALGDIVNLAQLSKSFRKDLDIFIDAESGLGFELGYLSEGITASNTEAKRRLTPPTVVERASKRRINN